MNTVLDFINNFLQADIRTAIPLLLAALGLVFSERAGIVNIGYGSLPALLHQRGLSVLVHGLRAPVVGSLKTNRIRRAASARTESPVA